MSNKSKYILSLLIMCVCFILMINVEPVGCIGDYLLTKMGIKAWSNGNLGFHNTILYFGVPAIISYVLMKVYMERAKMDKKTTFVLFIIFMTLLKFGTIEGSELVKANSSGLLSVGFDKNESHYDIRRDRGNVNFDINISLRNYSNRSKKFNVIIDNRFLEHDNNKTYILDKEGAKATFELDANESRVIVITHDNYLIESDKLSGEGSYQSSGYIQELILKDEDGQMIKLTSKGFFGFTIDDAS